MRHSSFLEVNLSYLGENFTKIQNLAPRAEILPMVKSDAYGNGILPISQYLVNECGAKKLGCASLGEALKIVEECPGLDVDILVFSDTELQNIEARKAYTNFKITPVLYQRSDLDIVLKLPEFRNIPLVLKLNTGMNRLGFLLSDLEPYFPELKKRGIDHLATHFARSSDILKPGDKTHRQFEEFLKMKAAITNAGIEVRSTSVANSGAIEQSFGVNETLVRPGLMLYGPPSVKWDGHQISRLVVKVLTTFQIKKGEPVGYGVNVADKDGFMVVVNMGYGDGLIAYDSGTKINVKGYTGKIFGRINMDMAFIFFDSEATGKIKNEEFIELWNHDNSIITDIATQNKTIPYKLMCGISSRIPRIYKVK